MGFSWTLFSTTSSPPSVVSSSRRSGTSVTCWGFTVRAMRTISWVAGHLHVQPRLHDLAQDLDVAVLDVPAVGAQVDGDAVGSRQLGQHGGLHGVGLRGPPRLAQRRHVVDVHAQPGHGDELSIAPRRGERRAADGYNRRSMKPSRDRSLGLHRKIDRRDFLNGVALTVGRDALAARSSGLGGRRRSLPRRPPGYYPPALTGLRGSHEGSYEVAHALKDGFFGKTAAPSDTGESYDLVVVGGGHQRPRGGALLSARRAGPAAGS